MKPSPSLCFESESTESESESSFQQPSPSLTRLGLGESESREPSPSPSLASVVAKDASAMRVLCFSSPHFFHFYAFTPSFGCNKFAII